MCGVPEYFGWDLGELCDAVRERSRDEWADPVDHRTAVLVAHHRAKDAGDERLADEMSRIDASLFEYVRDERGVGVRYLDSEHIEWIRRDPPPPRWFECEVVVHSERSQRKVGTIRILAERTPTRPRLRVSGKDIQALPPFGKRKALAELLYDRVWDFADKWRIHDVPSVRPACEEVAERILLLGPPGGYVYGAYSGGTVLMERELALDWVETLRLLTQAEAPYADLFQRLPDRARIWPFDSFDQFLEILNEELDEDDQERIEEVAAQLSREPRDWSWVVHADNWPYPGDPEMSTTIFDLPRNLLPDAYGYWPDVEGVVALLAERGVSCVEDQDLIDQALGPHTGRLPRTGHT